MPAAEVIEELERGSALPAGAPQSVRGRVRAAVREEPALLGMVSAIAAVDSLASILRHVDLQSGIDLAIFDQAVWHYSRFETPFSSIRGENILGDHFHPLVAVLAPLYWIWSDPRTLLIAQALLVAISIVPVFVFARRRLGRRPAYLVASAYAVFWGLQGGVLFDFHEVAFAPLLIALAIVLADGAIRTGARANWAWLWLVVVLLLGVKEDMSIVVVALGLYLVVRRKTAHGLALIAVGVGAYELITQLVIPHFATTKTFAHWTYGELGKSLPGAVWSLIKAPWRVFTIGFSTSLKAHTIFLLFVSFLFLTLASPLMIVVLALLAERFLSVDPMFWNVYFHYSMAIAPVLAMGAADGVANLSRLLPVSARARAAEGVCAAMLVASLGVSLTTSSSALYELGQGTLYTPQFDAGAAYRALAHVPTNASLTVPDGLLPHASERSQIHELDRFTIGATEYVVANVRFIGCCGTGLDGTAAALARSLGQDLQQMTPVYYENGWLAARRAPPGQAPGNGVLAPISTVLAGQLSGLIGAFDSDYLRLVPCYGRWFAGSASAPACFRAVVAAFERVASRLEAKLTLAQSRPSAACTQLAGTARHAAARLARGVRLVGVAASTSNRAALIAATRQLQNEISTGARFGELDVFLRLCSPRP